ncbi:MAG: ribosome biogenesis GTPase Der [Anaerolineae bacterium]
MAKPIVALVGRPNVGKSTLFNRLIGERKSVTSDIPGTTRDRIFGETDWNGVEFTLVDTGGIEVWQPKGVRDLSPLSEGSPDFVPQIRSQALQAVEEADAVILMVDAVQGITAADQDIAEILRKNNKPIVIAANKADNIARTEDAVEFYGLGVSDEVHAISSIHGTGTGDLLDAVVRALNVPPKPIRDPLDEDDENAPPEDDEDDGILKVAIVGRPNVGKSSLLNRLIGEERVIVSPLAGTTRDAIDMEITWNGMPVRLIDTAGIRKRGTIVPGIEQFSVIRAYKALERADVALLVLDAVDGVTAQDTHIAGMIKDANRSVIIVVNKWDAIEKDEHTLNEFTKVVRERFDFISYAPILFISAQTGQRIHTVMETAARVQEERLLRIPTSKLNALIRNAMDKHSPNFKTGQRLKIYYCTQVRVDPPTFLFHVNNRELVHFTYQRYLENQLRAEYGFIGTPLRLSFRNREREDSR